MKEHQIFNKETLKNIKTDYIIAIDKINRLWFTNFETSYGIVICDVKKQKIFSFLDQRYYAEGKKNSKIIVEKIENFVVFWKKLHGKVIFHKDISYAWKKRLEKTNPQIEWEMFNFQKFRTIKNEFEIEKIRHICKKTFNIWKKITKIIDQQKTEIDITKAIINNFYNQNVIEWAFFPICASNKNAAFIHTKAKNIKISDHLLCDFGGKLENYCSDFSRTFFLNDQSEIKKKYQMLLELQKKIIKKIKPNVKISEIVKIYHDFYKEKKWEIKHSLGHGIGLEVHEEPLLSIQNHQKLQKGMVFTIEPGVYFKDIGGARVEDVVVVNEKGCEILTK